MKTTKYKITINYFDGIRNSYVGVGRPLQTLNELMITSPDGSEIIVQKNNIRNFIVNRMEE